MIEINLIPDVKQEFIRSRRLRNQVISACILITIISGGAVALLASYVYGGQAYRSWYLDNTIKREHESLTKVYKLENVLTIQNQLEKVSEQHDKKNIKSRMFDVMTAIVGGDKSGVAVSKFSVDSNQETISIEGEAGGGYNALDVFKKTIEATKFSYGPKEDRQTVSLASDISDGERSFGENSDGRRVLRFELSFKYDTSLFSPESKNGVVIAPTKKNATDSAVAVPKGLFKASVNKEERED